MYYDGRRLCNEIARKKMSIGKFAKNAGMSQLSVQRALAGGKATIRSLGKIAAALGVENPCDLCKPQATANAI